MKILICDTLNKQVVEELHKIGDCVDISTSLTKHEDLKKHIQDSEIIVIRSSTKLTKEILKYGKKLIIIARCGVCLLYTSPSPRDLVISRMPSSA